MVEIIDIKVVYSRKSLEKAIGKMERFYDKAGSIANEYYSLMQENPDKAITELPQFLERVRNINENRYFCETLVGPNHDWTAPLFNVLGSLYHTLDREYREKILFKTMNYLDGLRFDYAQDNVELINNP